MSIVATLARTAARHYKDPTSWAGIVTAVLVAFHIKPDAAVVGNLDSILGAAIALALLLADGRRNPELVQPAADAPAIPSPSPDNVSTGDRTPLRDTAPEPPTPVRPGFGHDIP